MPRAIPDLSSANPNAYGPGVDRVPKGSTRYTIGQDGKPLRAWDAAVSPDKARLFGLKNNDPFLYRGKTYHYHDGSYFGVDKNRKLIPNTNTVEIWYPPGEKPGGQFGPGSRSPASSVADAARLLPTPRQPEHSVTAAARQLASDEWQTSPGDRRFLPPEGSGRPSIARSPSLVSDPNDDWIGLTPGVSSGPVVAGTSPSLITNPNDDWIGASPPLSTARIEPETQFTAPTFVDEWWLQPQNIQPDAGTGLTTAPDQGSLFGSADAATGRSWDTLATGGAEQGSHAFDFFADDNRPRFTAEAPAPELLYPEPQPEPPTIPNTLYEDPPSQYAGTEPEEPRPDLLGQEPPGATSQVASGPQPVPMSNFIPGMDQGARPMPDLFGFGPSPFSTMQLNDRNEPVGGGRIDYANTSTTSPGSDPGNLEQPSSEAEAQGARETVALRALGLLPSDESEPATGRAIEPEVRRALGLNELTPSQYAQATFGGLTTTGYRDPKGSAIGDSHAANLALMDWVAKSGGPTNLAQPDEVSRFYNGVWELDAMGQPQRVGERVPGYRRPTNPLIAGLTVNGRPWNSAPRAAPATGGGG